MKKIQNPENAGPNPHAINLRAPYAYDIKAASAAVAMRFEGEGRTKQSFAKECDINEIVRRFGITGKLPQSVRAPTYADYSGVSDYREALEAMSLAEESFAAMPATVRSRFENDPAQFVDFCSDPRNRAEAIKLGLIDLPEPPATPPAAPAAKAP